MSHYHPIIRNPNLNMCGRNFEESYTKPLRSLESKNAKAVERNPIYPLSKTNQSCSILSSQTLPLTAITIQAFHLLTTSSYDRFWDRYGINALDERPPKF